MVDISICISLWTNQREKNCQGHIPIQNSEVQTKDCKVRPRTDRECPEEEYKYSSTLSLTWALDGGE